MTESLSGREMVGMYLFLKKSENELDEILTQLMLRFEKSLYGRLSIEEFERLGELYRAGTDFFADKE